MLRILSVLLVALLAQSALANEVACQGWKPLFQLPAATFTATPKTQLWLIGDLHRSVAVGREAWELADRIRKTQPPSARGCVFAEISTTYQKQLDRLVQGQMDFITLLTLITAIEQKVDVEIAYDAYRELGVHQVERTPARWWQAMHAAGLRVIATDHPRSARFGDSAKEMQIRNAHIAGVIAEEFKSGRCAYGIGFYGLDHLQHTQSDAKLRTIGDQLPIRAERVLIIPSNEDDNLEDLIAPQCMGPWGVIPAEYRVSSSRLVSPKALAPATIWDKFPTYRVDRLPQVGDYDWVVLAR